MKALGLALVYFLAGRLAIVLSDSAGGIVPLWPSSAILLATLLRSPQKIWPLYIAACYVSDILVGVSVGDELSFASGFAAADILDVIVAAFLIGRLVGLPLRLETTGQLLTFVGVAAVLAPMAGASLAAFLQVLAYGDPYIDGWITWWISSSVGMVIVAPLWLELERGRLAAWWAGIVPAEVAAMVVFTSAFVTYAFMRPELYLLFLIMPFLLWSALRAGQFGAAAHNLLIMVPAVWFTVNGQGPIAGLYPGLNEQKVLFLQFFLAAMALPNLVSATVYAERLRAEQALNKTVEKLKDAHRIAKLSQWEWDAQEDRLWLPCEKSSAVADDPRLLQGLSDEDYIQRYVHPDDRDRIRQAYGAPARPNTEFDFEYRVVDPDGAERIVHEIGYSVYDERGELVTQAGTVQDVTTMRHAEQALRERDARLRDLQAQLARASRITTITSMSAAILHELTQPLTAIMNFVASARRIINKDPDAQPERLIMALDKVGQQAERATDVMQSLRRLYRGGKPEPRVQELNAAVEEACTLGLMSDTPPGMVSEIDLARGLPAVYIDRVQIQQVVINLLRNAAEAMADADARVLTVRTAEVNPNTVQVSVADTGPGLSEEARRRLFQPFVTTKSTGMGLGLTICQTIISEHGGKLWAEANPGGGTVFHFTLLTAEAGQSHGEQEGSLAG